LAVQDLYQRTVNVYGAERVTTQSLPDVEGPGPVEESVAEEIRAYAERNVAALKARTKDVWRWE